MHKCAHDESASQLTCVQRHPTLHEISSRLERLHATALALKLHMHKCAHDASASQLTCVQRHSTLHEISYATALALKLLMHKCAHDESASQLTCVQRHSTFYEISSRLDVASCTSTCTQTAHAQVCTRCKCISTDMCPAIPDYAGHGCMQLHLHSYCTCTSVHTMQAHLN